MSLTSPPRVPLGLFVFFIFFFTAILRARRAGGHMHGLDRAEINLAQSPQARGSHTSGLSFLDIAGGRAALIRC